MSQEATGNRLKRCVVAWISFVIMLAGGSANTAVARLVKSVEAVGITVSDVDRSADFFSRVLGFEKISDVEVHGKPYEKLLGVFGLRIRVLRMKLDEETIELTQYLAPEGRPIPPDWRSNDHSFQHIAIVVSDMDRAYQHLRGHKVRHASSGPQTIPASNKSAGGIRAFYFKDPDGHHLEIIYFPPGKGYPRWQQGNGRLFLGIDHTAIVVSNTAGSLKYYQDLLGLKIAGESLNSGMEQAHLNNVAGARLRITGLRAQRGPGVEFLEYLTPRSGRPAPQDTRANDIWHWQTILVTGSADEAMRNIRASNGRVVSPAVAALPDRSLGFTKGFLARDRDGHGVQIVQD
jgi:catechol 2,3-dioxygenase-like lactoylglutathione lyase family enzyme